MAKMTKMEMEMAKVVVDAVYHGTTAQWMLCDDISRGWGDDPTDTTGIIQWADRRIARLGDTSDWYPVEVLSAIIGRTGSEDIIVFRTAILAVLMAEPLWNGGDRLEWAEFYRPSHASVGRAWKDAKRALAKGRANLTCYSGVVKEDGYSSYVFRF